MQLFGSHGVTHSTQKWQSPCSGGWKRARKRRRVRDLLTEPLMRSSLIEIQDIGPEEAGELLLMEDQKVIEAFSPHASGESARRRHWPGACTIWRSKHLDAARCCYPRNIRTAFVIIIPNQILWCLSIGSRLPQRYAPPRDPSEIASHLRGSAFRDASSMKKKAKSGRKKRSITCKRITSPHPTPLPHDCARTFSRSVHPDVFGERASYTSGWFVCSPEYPA